MGAHLDSVGVGPGINDNGSGSAAILEIAEQLRGVFPKNKIRFIWFSAEESGPAGLGGLHRQPRRRPSVRKIAAMLNFDMIGSPNFVNFVYDGDLSDSPPIDEDDVRTRRRGRSRRRSRRSSWTTSRASGSRTSRRRSTGARTTARSSPRAVPAGGLFTGAEVRQDTGAGRDLRRHGRRSVRPVLPPRLRRLLQQQQPGAGHQLGRRRARADHAGADEDPGPGPTTPPAPTLQRQRRERGMPHGLPMPERLVDQ